jgi:hypothetical protein
MGLVSRVSPAAPASSDRCREMRTAGPPQTSSRNPQLRLMHAQIDRWAPACPAQVEAPDRAAGAEGNGSGRKASRHARGRSGDTAADRDSPRLYDAVLAHGAREKRIQGLEKPRKPVVVLATQPEPAA